MLALTVTVSDYAAEDHSACELNVNNNNTVRAIVL